MIESALGRDVAAAAPDDHRELGLMVRAPVRERQPDRAARPDDRGGRLEEETFFANVAGIRLARIHLLRVLAVVGRGGDDLAGPAQWRAPARRRRDRVTAGLGSRIARVDEGDE